MFNWLKKRSDTARPVPDADWQATCEDIAWIDGLDEERRQRLRRHVGRFLHEKRFSAAAGLELDDQDCLRIAALACLPVIDLGYECLRGWREVIVYPSPFRALREWHDEDSGVVSQSHDWLAGEAWLQGPLILSLDDILTDLEHPYEGNNLVAHEIAHKLDMLDGGSDGVPGLPHPGQREHWIATFHGAFERFRTQVDAGEETWLDPYAAEAPDEFFAVTSEAYFSAPDLLARFLPDVHRELRGFYGVELAVPAFEEDSR